MNLLCSFSRRFKKIYLDIRYKTLGCLLLTTNSLSKKLLKRFNYLGSYKYELVWNLDKFSGETDYSSFQIHTDKVVITKNCQLLGSTRFVIKGNEIALNIYSENERDLEKTFATYFMQEEAIGLVKREDKNKLVFRNDLSSVVYLQGCYISLLNPASDNWMHFVSEVLPVCGSIKVKYSSLDIAIIIDKNMSAQGKELIRIILPKHLIIEATSGLVINVEQLITPSTQTSYSAFWSRSKGDETGEYNFCAEAIRHTKDEIDRLTIKSSYQKKLVVRRNSFRVMENQNELLSLLEQQGFQVIEPEKNSIEENLKIFNSATVVVAQAGAALANMILMPKASTLVCLVADSKYIDVKYFEEFAKICEINIKFIFGSVLNPQWYKSKALFDQRHPMNAIFSVSEENLISQLNDCNHGF